MCMYCKCECSAAVLLKKLQQRSRVTKFLMGLNEGYEQTRRHIVMLKPIPTIEDVFKMVAQDERQKLVKHVLKVENAVFQTTGASTLPVSDGNEYATAYNTYQPRSSIPLCTHCAQLVHVIQKCFRLHEYPLGYKHYNSGQSFNKSGIVGRGLINLFAHNNNNKDLLLI